MEKLREQEKLESTLVVVQRKAKYGEKKPELKTPKTLLMQRCSVIDLHLQLEKDVYSCMHQTLTSL